MEIVKKIFKFASIVTGCLLFVGIICCTVLCLLKTRYDPETHLFVDVSPVAQERDIELHLEENGISEIYTVKLIKKMTPIGVTLLPFYSAGKTVTSSEIDESSVITAVNEFTGRIPRTHMQPSYLTKDCEFVPSVSGNEVDIKRLETDIISNLPDTTYYRVNDYYLSEVDTNEKELEALAKKLDASHITYDNGTTISAREMDPEYDDTTKTVSLNAAKIKERVEEISEDYDDIGEKTVSFQSTLRGNVEIKGGTWGSVPDTEAESEYAADALNNLEVSENRVPCAKTYRSFNLPDTYIEVDKENQKVFVYEDGELIKESDCVTGRYPDRTTPTGIFYVSECMTNKTLRGPGYASFVHRWMRLTNSGVGLHDASWRSSFGGDIYLRDGSHGCINLPSDFAYDLYDWVKTKSGLCVLVF